MGNERVQVLGGSRKKLQSKPGRKQQVSGSRPREVRQHMVRSEGSDGRNPRVHHGEGSDGRKPSLLMVVGPSFYPPFFPAYVTSLGA